MLLGFSHFFSCYWLAHFKFIHLWSPIKLQSEFKQKLFLVTSHLLKVLATNILRCVVMTESRTEEIDSCNRLLLVTNAVEEIIFHKYVGLFLLKTVLHITSS